MIVLCSPITYPLAKYASLVSKELWFYAAAIEFIMQVERDVVNNSDSREKCLRNKFYYYCFTHNFLTRPI